MANIAKGHIAVSYSKSAINEHRHGYGYGYAIEIDLLLYVLPMKIKKGMTAFRKTAI